MGSIDLSFHPDEIKEIIQKYSSLKNNGKEIIIGKTEIRLASDGLLGYQGEYFRMTADVEIKGVQKKLHFFIKFLSDTERGKSYRINFCREIEVYRTIFPEFETIRKSISCITPSLLVTDNLLVFEDLTKKEYKVKNSREYFDKPHCIVALKSLAELHASSIIYEETKRVETCNKNYNLAEEYADILKKCMWDFEGWFYLGMEAALVAAGESNKYGKETQYYAEIKTKWSQFFEDALQQSIPWKNRRNVISHMDLWAHNLMFHYKNNNPSHCIFVDFQSAICLPIQADVVSLIYLNVSCKERYLWYDDLIQYYYKELEIQLKQYGIKISLITTWESFKEDCESFKKFASVQSAILQQIGLWDPKAAENLLRDHKDYHRIMNISREEIILGFVKSDPLFKSRFLDLLDDLIANFIIEKPNAIKYAIK